MPIFYYEKSKQKDLQKVAFNDFSDIGIKDFVDLYKKIAAKPYYFLANNIILALDDPLYFRPNLLEKI